jgi:uncharacterized membrane protein (UPF0127 family)
MIDKIVSGGESKRIFIMLGAAGIIAIIGGGIYAAAINAVTPTHFVQRTIAKVASVLPDRPQGRTVQLKGEMIHVDVADTPASREQGLSDRASLASDAGMLFVFPRDDRYAFWMKDMRFSIDMVWLASDGTVVYIVRNASPDSYPTSFMPDTPARYVLELPAGWANAHRLAIGDRASL